MIHWRSFPRKAESCTPISRSRVTEQGSLLGSGTPLGREVHRSTSVTIQLQEGADSKIAIIGAGLGDK